MNFTLKTKKLNPNRLAAHKSNEARKRARDEVETRAAFEAVAAEFGGVDDDDDEDGDTNADVGVRAPVFVKAGSTHDGVRGTDDDGGPREVYTGLGGARRRADPSATKTAKVTHDTDVDANQGPKERVLDAMLHEFAANDAERRERMAHVDTEDAAGTSAGARFVADAGVVAFDTRHSTNVRITGLTPDIAEVDLASAFEMYGPIASVKIWKPTFGTAHSGFICFLSRTSAERFVAEMHNASCFGGTITAEMSKSLRLPLRAVWPLTRNDDVNFASTSADILRSVSASVPPAASEISHENDIVVVIPKDEVTRRCIDIVAAYVAEDGETFERELKAREARNERFQFLFERESSEYIYYMWRVFAYAQGDGDTSWRVDPFVMCDEGPRWIPPPMSQNEVAREVDADGGALIPRRGVKPATRLTPKDRDTWTDILHHVTIARDDIRDAMEFAIERAECAEDIVDIIAGSLVNAETSRASKLARLYVVSDVLHNSAAPVKGVQAYRGLFIRVLPHVFEHLKEYALAMSSTSSRTAFARRIFAILDAWGDFFLEDFNQSLRQAFTGPRDSANATTRDA